MFVYLLGKVNWIVFNMQRKEKKLCHYRNGQGLDHPKENFFKDFEKLLDFLVELDDKYYKDLRPNNDPEIALKKLTRKMFQTSEFLYASEI